MTRLTCAEADVLLGSHALGALDQAEARQLEEHIRGCAEHAEALAQLRHTVSVLPLLVDDREPSPALRDRIMEAVRRETPQPASAMPATGPAPSVTVPVPRFSWWRSRSVVLRRLAVAAALLIAVGVGLAAGSRLGQPSLQTWSLSGTPSAPSARGALVYAPGQQSAVLTVNGLPSLQPGQVYEAWLIRGGVPTDIGVSSGVQGTLVLRIAKKVTDYQVVAITIEPGQQPRPTSQPIVAGTLS